jgi:hypothetical protein
MPGEPQQVVQGPDSIGAPPQPPQQPQCFLQNHGRSQQKQPLARGQTMKSKATRKVRPNMGCLLMTPRQVAAGRRASERSVGPASLPVRSIPRMRSDATRERDFGRPEAANSAAYARRARCARGPRLRDDAQRAAWRTKSALRHGAGVAQHGGCAKNDVGPDGGGAAGTAGAMTGAASGQHDGAGGGHGRGQHSFRVLHPAAVKTARAAAPIRIRR